MAGDAYKQKKYNKPKKTKLKVNPLGNVKQPAVPTTTGSKSKKLNLKVNPLGTGGSTPNYLESSLYKSYTPPQQSMAPKENFLESDLFKNGQPQSMNVAPAEPNFRDLSFGQKYKKLAGIGQEEQPAPQVNPEAPYGMMGGVPATFEQSGAASQITADDLLMASPVRGGEAAFSAIPGLFGKKILQSAVKDAEKAAEEAAKVSIFDIIQASARAQAAKAATAKVSAKAADDALFTLEKKILFEGAGTEVKIASGQVVKDAAGKTVTSKRLAESAKWIATNPAFKWIKNHGVLTATSVAGWLFTGAFAYNEMGDTVFAYTLAADEAIKNGDIEQGQIYNDRAKELSDSMSYWDVLLGSAGYVNAAVTKMRSTTELSGMKLERAKVLKAEDTAFESRYETGDYTPTELENYLTRNPYSAISAVENNKKKTELTTGVTAEENTSLMAKVAAGTASKEELDEAIKNNPFTTDPTLLKYKTYVETKEGGIYDYIDFFTGEYVMSDLNRAKALLEAMQGGGQGTIDPATGQYVPTPLEAARQEWYNGGSSGANTPYEPPSSLNFGLLRTSGGYETADKSDPNVQGDFVTDPNEIAQYYFGVPYAQLTAQQKQLVDMMI